MKEFLICLICLIVYWIVCLMIDIHFKIKNIEILKRNIEIIQESTKNEKEIIEYNRKINKRIRKIFKKKISYKIRL